LYSSVRGGEASLHFESSAPLVFDLSLVGVVRLVLLLVLVLLLLLLPSHQLLLLLLASAGVETTKMPMHCLPCRLRHRCRQLHRNHRHCHRCCCCCCCHHSPPLPFLSAPEAFVLLLRTWLATRRPRPHQRQRKKDARRSAQWGRTKTTTTKKMKNDKWGVAGRTSSCSKKKQRRKGAVLRETKRR
jgi:hypothetical protein